MLTQEQFLILSFEKLASVCDVSCQFELSLWISSPFIVTSRPHSCEVGSPHSSLTSPDGVKGHFGTAHWLPLSVRRLGFKSLLLYLFRAMISSMCFTVMHFNKTVWFCLKLLLEKKRFISKKFRVARITKQHWQHGLGGSWTAKSWTQHMEAKLAFKAGKIC